MSRKYFNPNTGVLSEFNDEKNDWVNCIIDNTNIEEFLFLRDYIEAEMQIESTIEMQYDDYEVQFEKKLKKVLQN